MTDRFALLSVSDKTGIVELAGQLVKMGFGIVASGGTARVIAASGIAVREVGELTGAGELMSGRVKTLSPTIFAGILGRRGLDSDEADLVKAHGGWIDFVACNFYQLSGDGDLDPGQIDIGGPALVRAAAKNCERVTVVVDPADYSRAVTAAGSDDLNARALRNDLAGKSWRYVAAYDNAIARRCGGFGVSGDPHLPLRYGENPHQAAQWSKSGGPGIHDAERFMGPDLSYNNILDLSAAMELAVLLGENGAAVVKHQNPCGAAVLPAAADSLGSAIETDRISAFGGVAALNGTIDAGCVERMKGLFLELVVARSYSRDALEMLRTRKKIRVLAWSSPAWPREEFRWVPGGALSQVRDDERSSPDEWSFVTSKRPSEDQITDMMIAEAIAKVAKSNAIAIVKDRRAVGIGSGQVNRLDAVKQAVLRAGAKIAGAAMASDGFFPFSDGVEAAAGIAAVLQPGGSIRDDEVIAAADRMEIVMCFTGLRHFRH